MHYRSPETGFALVLALILTLVVSVMGASVMFLSQTETLSSLNYEMMTQARYGAESGLNTAANYLVNTYTAPISGGADDIANYDMTKSPVQYNGVAVVLSASTSSNYPVASVKTAFSNAAQGTVVAGQTTMNYTATATLVAMSQVTTAAGPTTVQTWSITADGTISGGRSAQEEVSSIVERQVTWAQAAGENYAMFATANGCGSLTMSGGVTIGSYDSAHATISGGAVVPDTYGGDIGSNGNLNESGGATVHGTMSTPRSGVGNCSSGGVDAWSDSGGATVTGCSTSATSCVSGGLVHLSQAVSLAAPSTPNPEPPTTNLSITSTTTCTSLGISGCTGTAGNLVFAPGSYGNISLSGGAKLTISGGAYTINSISVSGGAALTVNATGSTPAIVTIAGQSKTTPLSFSGGGITNVNASNVPTPTKLQFLYAGTGTLSLSGGTQTAGTVYAPNAAISLSGGARWYGSISGATISDSGGTAIYYDRELGNPGAGSPIATVGNFMMNSFSWSRF
ncbi:MAG TPA: pilus assembly PilX N-terminal domain-containing protein [Terriglobia bacterium]